MPDFLRDCNSGELKIDNKTFTDTWCAKCRRPDCDLAALAKIDPMAQRNATWREKFFGATEADLSIPKFAQIARTDFPNLLQKAMKLEISARRGDWSVPEIPVLDGRIQAATKDTTAQVEAAARRLAGKGVPPLLALDDVQDPEEPDEALPEPPEDDEDEPPEDDEPEAPPPAPVPRKAPPPQPSGRNTLDPGEVMIGGGPAPATTPRGRPAPELDPWAAPPKPSVVIVSPGARVQFGKDDKAR